MRIRLTDRIGFIKTAEKKKNEDQKRSLDGFDFNPAKAAVLKRVLHSLNIALGNLISALRELSMLRGSEITPDGLLGGRGFIMPFKEIKSILNESVIKLSDVTDTIADELTNPKWGLNNEEKKKIVQKNKKIEEEVKEISDQQEDKNMPPNVEEDIVPEDVKDAEEIEKMKKLIVNKKDKVASILGKNILANLLK